VVERCGIYVVQDRVLVQREKEGMLIIMVRVLGE
jgi:hypothetical protein